MIIVVSKAFQVLSDPDKRAAFDRHGADPDSRSAGFSTDTPFTRGRTHFANADEGMDADQLFRMFFGGGMGGGMFDGPGVQFGPGPTVFQFGGGMPRVRRTGAGSWAQQMHNQRARQADDQQARAPTSWVTFMPIIIFFVISLLQSFPSLFSAPRTPDPTFSWGPSSVYPVQRVTLNHAGVKCKNSLAPRVLYGSVDWASGFEFLQILSIRMNLVLIHSTKPISPPILN